MSRIDKIKENVRAGICVSTEEAVLAIMGEARKKILSKPGQLVKLNPKLLK